MIVEAIKPNYKHLPSEIDIDRRSRSNISGSPRKSCSLLLLSVPEISPIEFNGHLMDMLGRKWPELSTLHSRPHAKIYPDSGAKKSPFIRL